MGRLLDALEGIIRREHADADAAIERARREHDEADAAIERANKTAEVLIRADRRSVDGQWDDLINKLDRAHLGEH